MNTLTFKSKTDTNSDMNVVYTFAKDGTAQALSSSSVYTLMVLDLEGNTRITVPVTSDNANKTITFKTSDFGKVGVGTYQLKLIIDSGDTNHTTVAYPNGDQCSIITLARPTLDSAGKPIQYPHYTVTNTQQLKQSDLVAANYNVGAPSLELNKLDFTKTVANQVSSETKPNVYLNSDHNLAFDIPQGKTGATWKPYIAKDGHWHATLTNGDVDPIGGENWEAIKNYIVDQLPKQVENVTWQPYINKDGHWHDKLVKGQIQPLTDADWEKIQGLIKTYVNQAIQDSVQKKKISDYVDNYIENGKW